MLHSQTTIEIDINGTRLPVALERNKAVEKLLTLLPLSVELTPYGGFEAVGDLPCSLPAEDRHLKAVAGDLMLYRGKHLVVFHGSNSWAYTPLGKITGSTAAELRRLLEGATSKVTLCPVEN